jgi:hypothetical protein
MNVVDYEPAYASAFERLNLEWLEKYFWVEDIGRDLLLAAIARFESISGKNLFLETHSSLQTAIKLYGSAGFHHASHPAAQISSDLTPI